MNLLQNLIQESSSSEKFKIMADWKTRPRSKDNTSIQIVFRNSNVNENNLTNI